MKTHEKVLHAKCLLNAARHYLNLAFDDRYLDSETKTELNNVISVVDMAQYNCSKLYRFWKVDANAD